MPSGPGDHTLISGTVSLVDPSAGETRDTRYTRLELLGQGGMGEVSLCSDGVIGREVAMKTARADLDDAASAARFAREARVQGQLEHPSVVPVYDFFRGADGRWRFTMKRVRGRTLEEVIAGVRDGDPEISSAHGTRKLLSAFSSVCLSIAFAHARGVVHRDLKPANIMLGEFGEVHVLDWGLAKVLGAPDPLDHGKVDGTAETISIEGSDPPLTIAGHMMGTPGYMSPEQAQGESEIVDGRTDIYALGSILFEILTLRPLHDGKHPIHRIGTTLRGADARARVRAPERNVAPELEAICIRATALDPNERQASAMDIHRAVELFLEGDRDLERRRAMADEHVTRAKEARATYQPARDASMRSLALREAGAALAIDPNHAEARDLTLALLVDVPREVPPEAREEFDASSRVVEKSSRTGQLVQYVAWLAFVPMIVGVGITDFAWFWTMCAVLTIAIGGAIAHVVHRMSGRFAFVVFLFGTAFAAMTAGGFGPLVLTPQLAVTNVLSYVPFAERRFRVPAILLSLAAVVVPFVLMRAGVIAYPYAFESGALVIRSPAIHLIPGSTEGLLLIAAIALVGATPFMLGRMRDQVDAAEKRSFLHAWSLRQVLPASRVEGP